MAKKLILDCKDKQLWKDVMKYKIDAELRNANQAVLNLIKKGLNQK